MLFVGTSVCFLYSLNITITQTVPSWLRLSSCGLSRVCKGVKWCSFSRAKNLVDQKKSASTVVMLFIDWGFDFCYCCSKGTLLMLLFWFILYLFVPLWLPLALTTEEPPCMKESLFCQEYMKRNTVEMRHLITWTFFSTAQVLHSGYCGQRPEEEGQEDPRSANHVHLKPQVTCIITIYSCSLWNTVYIPKCMKFKMYW